MGGGGQWRSPSIGQSMLGCWERIRVAAAVGALASLRLTGA